ncbi:DUF4230 domain-containing protein [Exiguobacterium sp. SRB7LM]|uniref:DUF4230 domain-containing protein n=1 Tax=Exiguobacterium sp. SRB7LM TaxID=2608401 RepID=UPI0018C3F273|nr:DUF4230 domain-containing protein [Exiguobacterium sp. SRB7LM]MBG0918722.1 DUF4230 domain-containing protein [Exiguobacterium sp. SRB7LM]
MKRMIGRVSFVLLTLVLIGVIAIVVIKPSVFSTNQQADVSLVKDRLVELTELTTLKYEYSNVIVSRNTTSVSLIGLKDVKLAEAIKLIEYSGYLKAGTDLSNMEVSYNDTTEKLTVTVPHSTILDNVANTDDAVVTDVKGTLFSDYPSQLIFDEINKEKENMEKTKIDQGLLTEADKRIEAFLTEFLKNSGYETVAIEFK